MKDYFFICGWSLVVWFVVSLFIGFSYDTFFPVLGLSLMSATISVGVDYYKKNSNPKEDL